MRTGLNVQNVVSGFILTHASQYLRRLVNPLPFGTVILVEVVTPCITASYDDAMKLTSFSAVTVNLSL